jgi:hypothetical protein
MLTTQQIQILRAAIDCLIPPDDFPGGWEAGVGDYLLRQFAHDLRPQLEMYRIGLDALDQEAQARTGQPFAELTPDAQTALLEQVEQGHVITDWPLAPADFFRQLVDHVMEGYYGDPGNGGNRNAIAWQMIGFEVRE